MHQKNDIRRGRTSESVRDRNASGCGLPVVSEAADSVQSVGGQEIQPIDGRSDVGEFMGYRFTSKGPLPRPSRKAFSESRIGTRFGRLVCLETLGVATGNYRWYGCVCDCGVKCAVRSRELDRGHTQSCGCLFLESVRSRAGNNRLPYGQASRNELLGSYKKSASSRGFEWGLEDNEFFRIVSSNCGYCGSPPDSYWKPKKQVNGGVWYSGVDRIDNNCGYVKGNVYPCCWTCNRAKGTLPEPAFRRWIARLVEFTKKARPSNG